MDALGRAHVNTGQLPTRLEEDIEETCRRTLRNVRDFDGPAWVEFRGALVGIQVSHLFDRCCR